MTGEKSGENLTDKGSNERVLPKDAVKWSKKRSDRLLARS